MSTPSLPFDKAANLGKFFPPNALIGPFVPPTFLGASFSGINGSHTPISAGES
jgi:hypothetical protein